MVVAEEGKLVLAYWLVAEPPCHPSAQPLGIVRFHHPCFHLFGPPGEDAISGHPLSGRGLYPGGAFRVDGSSLVRHLARMTDVEGSNPTNFEALAHFIFTFHDSTFECVAESFEATVEQVGLDEEHARTLQFLKSQ